MRTIKEASEACNIPESLIRAVIRQIGGKETLRDVCRGGADAGFAGFSYYSDTIAFFKRQRAAIVALVEDMADSLGESAVAMVRNFNCLRDDKESESSVVRCLGGGRLRDEDTMVANALAWFALEEVARAVCDE